MICQRFQAKVYRVMDFRLETIFARQEILEIQHDKIGYFMQHGYRM